MVGIIDRQATSYLLQLLWPLGDVQAIPYRASLTDASASVRAQLRAEIPPGRQYTQTAIDA